MNTKKTRFVISIKVGREITVDVDGPEMAEEPIITQNFVQALSKILQEGEKKFKFAAVTPMMVEQYREHVCASLQKIGQIVDVQTDGKDFTLFCIAFEYNSDQKSLHVQGTVEIDDTKNSQ